MAIKDIIDTAVDVGKSAVTRGKEVAERRLRGDKEPSTAAAPKPGEPGAPKSATASTRAQAATAPTRAKKAKPKAKAKPRKPAKKRSTATRAAAKSADEVKDAAKK
jgi:hypothetical protein